MSLGGGSNWQGMSWTCSTCGAYVPPGVTHHCTGLSPKSDPAQWHWVEVDLTPVLERLERIEQRLDASVSATLEVTEMRESAKEALLQHRKMLKAQIDRQVVYRDDASQKLNESQSEIDRSLAALEEIEAELREGGVELVD